MSANEALLQYLLAIAVQIRHGRNEEQVVGTGVVVSPDGKIATCAHVVRDAGVDPRSGEALPGFVANVFNTGQRAKGEVGVYFSPVPGIRSRMMRRAHVWKSFPETNDDIVVLELVGDPPNLTAREVAVLGRSEPSFGNKFWSVGFVRLPKTVAHSAEGIIHLTEPEFEGCLIGRVTLNSSRIQKGMSGAPVLDSGRNLVVGLISNLWDSDDEFQNRDAAWGVNARVLGLEPVGLVIRDEALPLATAPQSQIGSTVSRSKSVRTPIAWNGGVERQSNWVGREAELEALSAEWCDERVRVSVWASRAGQGKSSLVRHWLVQRSAKTQGPHPDGIFWWTFGQSGTVDQFFDRAILYLTDGKNDSGAFRSQSERAHVLGTLLYTRRCILVLDALDEVQHLEGDLAGFVKHPDLAQFLTFCATPQHESFCIVTSRLMVSDLLAYSPQIVSRHDLEALSRDEARDLLARLAPKAQRPKLDEAVRQAGGNPLTLVLQAPTLLQASSAPRAHQVGHAKDGVASADDLGAALRTLDQRLSRAERAVLMIASVIRVPFALATIDAAVAGVATNEPVVAALAAMEPAGRAALVAGLVKRAVLNVDSERQEYSAHSLVRAHYQEELRALPLAPVQALHSRLYEEFRSNGPEPLPEGASLQDLVSLIEAVHHGVLSGRIEEAFEIYIRLALPPRSLLFHELGAVETDLALVREFFPGGDLDAEPTVANPMHKSWLINEAGVCMAALGSLPKAIGFLERSVALASAHQAWREAAASGTNLANMDALIGSLRAAWTRAVRAYRDGRRTDDLIVHRQTVAICGWIAGLLGRRDRGLQLFDRAERLALDHGMKGVPLEGALGLRHAELLCRSDRVPEGTAMARQLLDFATEQERLPMMSIAYRILADWDQHLTDGERRRYLDDAVRLARLVRRQEALIEALIARGKRLTTSSAARALVDLEEALSASRSGGYRLLQIEAHRALATFYAAQPDEVTAQNQMAEAARIALETGYDPAGAT